MRRYDILDAAWSALYKTRWPNHCQRKQVVAWFDRNEEKCESIDDWQQKYWEAHLQEYAQLPNSSESYNFIYLCSDKLLHYRRVDHSLSSSCLDAVAETALLPSYDGSVGEIQIPGSPFDCSLFPFCSS